MAMCRTILLIKTLQPMQYVTKRDTDVKFKRFQATLTNIDELNAAEIAAGGLAVYGITTMANLSPSEFESKYLRTYVPPEDERMLSAAVEVGESHLVDLRGVSTTPVKNQGGCSTCW